jgi:pimeloyl-ACP methyl ester carboxylesterase
VGRVAVIAYSAGVTSAIQLALRHPARVAALALVSPNAPGPVMAIPPRAVMELLFRTDVAFWLAVTYFPAAIRAPMGVPKGLPLTAEDEAEVAVLLRTVLPARPRGPGYLFDAYVSNPDINTGYPFGDIAAPVLVVAARDDPTAPYANARALAGRIPGARLVTLERGGHLGLGQRDRTTRAIRAFLREHAAARQPTPARVAV